MEDVPAWCSLYQFNKILTIDTQKA